MSEPAVVNPLEDFLCFDLYAASRAVTARYRPLLAELDLTYPQYLVLVLLADEAPRPIAEIAGSLRLDHGTLTPLLRRLEESGLVSRTRSRTDERVVEVDLTTRGRDTVERFAEVRCAMEEAMGLDPAGARDLQQRLRNLIAQVNVR